MWLWTRDDMLIESALFRNQNERVLCLGTFTLLYSVALLQEMCVKTIGIVYVCFWTHQQDVKQNNKQPGGHKLSIAPVLTRLVTSTIFDNSLYLVQFYLLFTFTYWGHWMCHCHLSLHIYIHIDICMYIYIEIWNIAFVLGDMDTHQHFTTVRV